MSKKCADSVWAALKTVFGRDPQATVAMLGIKD